MYKWYHAVIAILYLCFSALNCIAQPKPILPTYEEFRVLQKSYTSSEGVLKYIDKGEGPVIVLLHGVPTSGWLYRKMIDGLVDGGYRVIVPDMLGYGSSDSPKGYEIYSNEAHAKRLLELMDSLEIGSWTQTIHDAGGLWTWELLKIDPDRIEKLIILNTILNEEGFYPPVRMKPGAMAKAAMWGYRNPVTRGVLVKKLFNTGLINNELDDDDLQGYLTPLKEGKTKGMYYFFSKTCNEFVDESTLFETIKIPKLVVWGMHDEILQWTPQESKVMDQFDIAKERVHMVNEKHFLQETQYKPIVKYMLRFLEDLK